MHKVDGAEIDKVLRALEDEANPSYKKPMIAMIRSWLNDPIVSMSSADRTRLEEAVAKHGGKNE